MLAGCLGAGVAYAALGLVPPVRHEVGPAVLEAALGVGPGRTALRVPPLGTVSAATHATPVGLRLSVAEVDVPALAERVEDAAARADLAREVESGLRELGPRLALRVTAAAVLVGAVATAILPRRRPAYVVSGAAGALLLCGVLVGGTAVSFDVDAFSEPRFSGALVRAPVVIAALQRREITFESVQSRYETAAGRLSDLLALVADPNQDPAEESVAVLHVSDIHSNPLGVELTAELAERFDVDAIVDTGDLTSFGVTAEARIGRLIKDIPVPYYLVPGNHDSAANEAALDRVPNVTVLDGEVAEIDGVRVLGWGDPTDTNWNRISPDEAALVREEEGETTALEVARAAPDVLAVHDRRLAQASLGEVPLVLAGHYHRRIVEEEEGTTIMSVGSTGATGLDFFVEADRPYEAEIVYFRDSTAVAVDYVSFGGLGADFEIERTTLDDPTDTEAVEPDAEAGEPCTPVRIGAPGAAGCVSSFTGDFDGDGLADKFSVFAYLDPKGFPIDWNIRLDLRGKPGATFALIPADGFTYPEAVGATDADGDGDDEMFVNVADHVYHGGTTSVLALYRMLPGALVRVDGPGGKPLDIAVGGVSNFGEGLECRDLDGDGTPELQLLRIDSASSARSRWSVQVYRWTDEGSLELVEKKRGTLRRRGFTDPRVLRFYELHCGRLDPPYPY